MKLDRGRDLDAAVLAEDNGMASLSAVSVELHFQDGFRNETLLVEQAGEVVLKVEATTETMLALAEIVTLDAKPGEELLVRMQTQPDQAVAVTVDADAPYVLINFADGTLTAELQSRLPGYM